MQTFREMKCEMKVKRELEEGFLCTKERERETEIVHKGKCARRQE